jgi:ABC-type multidrug transport system fused ATPase/permease subunit
MRKNASEKKPRLTWSGLKRFFQLYKYIKPHRGSFFLGLLFLMASSLSSLAFPKLLGDLVNDANADAFVSAINQTALILFVMLILQAVFSYFRVVLFVNVTEKALAALRQAVYQHLIVLPMTFFNQKRVGELNSRISADIALLQETFTTTLAEFLRQIIIIVGGIGLLWVISWKLTLFMLATFPPVVLIAVVFGRYIRNYSKKVQEEVASSNTIVEETLQAIMSVKAYANEWYEVNRYRQKTDAVATIAIKGGKYRASFSAFIILGIFGAISAVIWRGTMFIADGTLQTGDLFSFVLYSVFIGGSVGGMADIYARLQKAIGSTEALLEMLEEPIEPIDVQETPARKHRLRGALAFENVSFAYPNRPDHPVLEAINLQVKPGERVALVGPSGAGKTTLASLVFGFYQPDKGTLTYDGQLMSDLSLSDVRSQMALVPQDIVLFGGTIRENIAYGKPQATEDEIVQAARKANAWEFIDGFPEGLETLVGERGVQLSGGQRQRIAIARAILKDPAILVLDEATSALDSESERLVQEALHVLMENRTSIIIAHRLSTIRTADTILVLENGSIAESGNHETLVKKEAGLYKNLYSLQELS